MIKVIGKRDEVPKSGTSDGILEKKKQKFASEAFCEKMFENNVT